MSLKTHCELCSILVERARQTGMKIPKTDYQAKKLYCLAEIVAPMMGLTEDEVFQSVDGQPDLRDFEITLKNVHNGTKIKIKRPDPQLGATLVVRQTKVGSMRLQDVIGPVFNASDWQLVSSV